ncbi:hypothetical protein HA402_012511 [Bradysia odoriphaga]|nr:hypothetical protein HA402_012511 [Bradysia odoriphaga]
MDNKSLIEPTTSPTFWNSSLNVTNYDYEPFALRYGLEATIALSVAYIFVFIAGIIGNVAIFLTVRKSADMRRLTTHFIINLAAADLLVLIFCLPFTLAANIFPAWIFGAVFCKLVSYLQGVSVSASVNAMMFVAVDRYMAISSPLVPKKSKRYYLKAVLAVWITALTINLPWLYVFELETVENGSNIEICTEIWPSPTHEKLFFIIANVLMFYLGPLVVISICYILIWQSVRRRNVPGEYNDQRSVINCINKSRLKVAKMVFVIILTFAVSWFPLYCVFVIVKFGDDFLLNERIQSTIYIIVPIAQWMGAANSCINPFLFVHMDTRFRIRLTRIITLVRVSPMTSRLDTFFSDLHIYH